MMKTYDISNKLVVAKSKPEARKIIKLYKKKNLRKKDKIFLTRTEGLASSFWRKKKLLQLKRKYK